MFQDTDADPKFMGLSDHIREEESDRMAASEQTKMFVPTRSRLSAPNKPPFETAVGLLAALVDKISSGLSCSLSGYMAVST